MDKRPFILLAALVLVVFTAAVHFGICSRISGRRRKGWLLFCSGLITGACSFILSIALADDRIAIWTVPACAAVCTVGFFLFAGRTGGSD
jgi:hypothetical protein